MEKNKERIVTAQWVLERNLAWIAAAEVKVGVIVAIDTAMLGALGASYTAVDKAAHTTWTFLFTSVALFALGAGLFCTAMAVLPRVTGPSKSLLFFGRVSAYQEADYKEEFKSATDAEILEDWTAQIHRNAQIARDKFSWVRSGMYWSFLSLLPWFAAIASLLSHK